MSSNVDKGPCERKSSLPKPYKRKHSNNIPYAIPSQKSIELTIPSVIRRPSTEQILEDMASIPEKITPLVSPNDECVEAVNNIITLNQPQVHEGSILNNLLTKTSANVQPLPQTELIPIQDSLNDLNKLLRPSEREKITNAKQNVELEKEHLIDSNLNIPGNKPSYGDKHIDVADHFLADTVDPMSLVKVVNQSSSSDELSDSQKFKPSEKKKRFSKKTTPPMRCQYIFKRKAKNSTDEKKGTRCNRPSFSPLCAQHKPRVEKNCRETKLNNQSIVNENLKECSVNLPKIPEHPVGSGIKQPSTITNKKESMPNVNPVATGIHDVTKQQTPRIRNYNPEALGLNRINIPHISFTKLWIGATYTLVTSQPSNHLVTVKRGNNMFSVKMPKSMEIKTYKEHFRTELKRYRHYISNGSFQMRLKWIVTKLNPRT